MKIQNTLKILDEIKNSEDLYTVRCNISILDNGIIRLGFDTEAYALINEEALNPMLIFPLTNCEDQSGRNSEYAIKLAKGTEVELHVKNITHNFKIADTRPFYIDINENKIIYIDEINSNGDERCNKFVYVADIYCCSGGFLEGGFGWVGCSAGWRDSKCCR